MSKAWYIRCDSCNETTEAKINHGQKFLQALVQSSPIILPVLKLPDEIPDLWPLQVEYKFMEWNDFIPFLRTHYEHGVVFESEYGEVETVQGKRVKGLRGEPV